MNDKGTTHFGYEQVQAGEKAKRVREVFDSVATKYDLMNDLMSFGIHRLWKRYAVELAGLRPGHKVLDLASGTGDLAARYSGLVGPEGLVTMTDINAAMLDQGRARMADRGLIGNVEY
ncbi:MAG: class I SAM-dependent methyltransferase, partial [Planctomycetes bacterium]|nr:class I SAM-dependent methyltransferase [Planctomycetota bacterium]